MKGSLLKNISLINKLTLKSRGLKNEKEIIKRFVDTTKLILKADYGFAFVRNNITKDFQIIYKDHKTPYVPKQPRKNGTTVKAFKQKTSIFVNHISKTPGIKDDAKKFMKGVVVIPIVYEKEKYGVIDICFYKSHKFTHEEKILCEYIGNSAAQVFAIKKTEQKLWRVMLQKDEFFNIASHELKTPITTIKGFSQILNDRAKTMNKESNYFITKIVLQVNKLEHLVGDMLDISRIENGKMGFEKKNFELVSLIKRVVEDMKIATPQHSISFVSSNTFWVNADEERIERVVINFINNAAKYSPLDSKIKVRAEADGQNVRVSVEDFGYGISEEDKSKIFNRFFQSKPLDKKIYSGLGLGLYIAKEIIDQHKGTVGFLSKKSTRGTIFFFTLPHNKRI